MLRYLKKEQIERAKEIPGCRKKLDGRWEIPPNCYGLFGLGSAPIASAETRRYIARRLPVHMEDTIYNEQRDDMAFALDAGGALLAHATAAGKTFMGLGLAAVRDTWPLVVFGPAIATHTWRTEAEKWLLTRSFHRVSTRKPYTLPKARVYYVPLEIVRYHADNIAALGPAMAVLDESHEIRRHRSKRTQELRAAVSFSSPFRLGLTATPQWVGIHDMWTQLSFLAPGQWGTYSQFIKRYAGAHETEWGGLELGRATNATELRSRLEWCFRRRDKSLDRIDRRLYTVEAPGAARKLAAAARSAAAAATVNGELDTAKFEKLMHGALAEATPKKIAKLKTLLDALHGAKVMVVTQRIVSAKKVCEKLDSLGRAYTYFDGTVPLTTRILRINEAARRGALVCTAGAARQSIDCSGLDAMIVLEAPYSPNEAVQLEGRIDRPAQESSACPVLYVAVENSYDSQIYETVLRRLDSQASTIGLGQVGTGIRDMLRGDTADRALAKMLARQGVC